MKIYSDWKVIKKRLQGSPKKHSQKTLPKKQEQQTPPNPTKIKFHKKTTEKKRSRSGERIRVSPMKETPLKSQLKPSRQQSVTYESNLKIYNEE